MLQNTEDAEDLLDDEEEAESPELYEHHRIEADNGQNLLRVDKFLMTRLPNASRTKIQEAADAGNIRVNGNPVKSSYKVKPRDIVTVVMAYPRREIEIIPENIPLDIVHEDHHLMVVNKPAGMVVHPAYGHYSGTLVNALAWHLRDNPLFQTGDPRPGLVHRIDKDTSGLLVIAKTEKAKAHLASQFFHKTSDRKYVAVCWGNLDADSGTITGHIGRNLANRKPWHASPTAPTANTPSPTTASSNASATSTSWNVYWKPDAPTRYASTSNTSNTPSSTTKNTEETKS